MSTAEERMQNEIDELEQENRLLRARNERLEREGEMRRLALLDVMQAAPVLSAGPITAEMANWSAEDKAELVAVIAKHTSPVQEPHPLDVLHIHRNAVERTLKCLNSPQQADLRLVLRDLYAALTTPPAAQRQWVGLTDGEMPTLVVRSGVLVSFPETKAFVKAIEAKLKEKNV